MTAGTFFVLLGIAGFILVPVSTRDRHFVGGSISYEFIEATDDMPNVKVTLLTGWTLGDGPCGPNCSSKDIGKSTDASRAAVLENKGNRYFGYFVYEEETNTNSTSPISTQKWNRTGTVTVVNEHTEWEQEMLTFITFIDRFIDIRFEGGFWREYQYKKKDLKKEEYNLQAKISPRKRNDTGKPNSSPVILPKPVYQVSLNSFTVLRIPSMDKDDDIIQCRQSEFVAQGSVHEMQNITINRDCSVEISTYEADGFHHNWWGLVALTFEDVNRHDISIEGEGIRYGGYSKRNLNRINIKFMVHTVENLTRPEFVHPTKDNNHEFIVYVGSTLSIDLWARQKHGTYLDIKSFHVVSVPDRNFTVVPPTRYKQTETMYSQASWKTEKDDVGKYLIRIYALDASGNDGNDMSYTVIVKDVKYTTTVQNEHNLPYFTSFPASEIVCKVNSTCIVSVKSGSKLEITNSSIAHVDISMDTKKILDGVTVHRTDVTVLSQTAGTQRICLRATNDKREQSKEECIKVIIGHKDACNSLPCLNGGRCRQNEASFDCTCSFLFTGAICETQIDICASNPCQYGTCHIATAQLVCVCPPNYTGKYCQISLHCNDVGVEDSQKACVCPIGITGSYCESVIAPVSDKPQTMILENGSTIKCSKSPCLIPIFSNGPSMPTVTARAMFGVFAMYIGNGTVLNTISNSSHLFYTPLTVNLVGEHGEVCINIDGDSSEKVCYKIEIDSPSEPGNQTISPSLIEGGFSETTLQNGSTLLCSCEICHQLVVTKRLKNGSCAKVLTTGTAFKPHKLSDECVTDIAYIPDTSNLCVQAGANYSERRCFDVVKVNRNEGKSLSTTNVVSTSNRVQQATTTVLPVVSSTTPEMRTSKSSMKMTYSNGLTTSTEPVTTTLKEVSSTTTETKTGMRTSQSAMKVTDSKTTSIDPEVTALQGVSSSTNGLKTTGSAATVTVTEGLPTTINTLTPETDYAVSSSYQTNQLSVSTSLQGAPSTKREVTTPESSKSSKMTNTNTDIHGTSRTTTINPLIPSTKNIVSASTTTTPILPTIMVPGAASTSTEMKTPPSSMSTEMKTTASQTTTEIKTPASQTTTDMKTPASQTSTEMKTPASQTTTEMKTPASQTSTEMKTTASLTSTEMKTSASQTTTEMKTPASQTSTEMKTPASQTSPKMKTPASQTSPKMKTPSSSMSTEMTTPASPTSTEMKTPPSSMSTEMKTPASPTSTEMKTPASQTSTEIKTPASPTSTEIKTPASPPQMTDTKTGADVNEITTTPLPPCNGNGVEDSHGICICPFGKTGIQCQSGVTTEELKTQEMFLGNGSTIICSLEHCTIPVYSQSPRNQTMTIKSTPEGINTTIGLGRELGNSTGLFLTPVTILTPKQNATICVPVSVDSKDQMCYNIEVQSPSDHSGKVQTTENKGDFKNESLPNGSTLICRFKMCHHMVLTKPVDNGTCYQVQTDGATDFKTHYNTLTEECLTDVAYIRNSSGFCVHARSDSRCYDVEKDNGKHDTKFPNTAYLGMLGINETKPHVLEPSVTNGSIVRCEKELCEVQLVIGAGSKNRSLDKMMIDGKEVLVNLTRDENGNYKVTAKLLVNESVSQHCITLETTAGDESRPWCVTVVSQNKTGPIAEHHKGIKSSSLPVGSTLACTVGVSCSINFQTHPGAGKPNISYTMDQLNASLTDQAPDGFTLSVNSSQIGQHQVCVEMNQTQECFEFRIDPNPYNIGSKPAIHTSQKHEDPNEPCNKSNYLEVVGPGPASVIECPADGCTIHVVFNTPLCGNNDELEVSPMTKGQFRNGTITDIGLLKHVEILLAPFTTSPSSVCLNATLGRSSLPGPFCIVVEHESDPNTGNKHGEGIPKIMHCEVGSKCLLPIVTGPERRLRQNPAYPVMFTSNVDGKSVQAVVVESSASGHQNVCVEIFSLTDKSENETLCYEVMFSEKSTSTCSASECNGFCYMRLTEKRCSKASSLSGSSCKAAEKSTMVNAHKNGALRCTCADRNTGARTTVVKPRASTGELLRAAAVGFGTGVAVQSLAGIVYLLVTSARTRRIFSKQ